MKNSFILICASLLTKYAFAVGDEDIQTNHARFKYLTLSEDITLMTHLSYTYGAFLGSITGSFLVHCGDTLATRSFSGAKKQDLWSITKIFSKSYLPVGIGVVPMRALSFGVYSVAQQFFYNCDGFKGKVIGGIISGLSLAILSTPAEIIKTRKQLELDVKLPWYKSLKANEIRSNFVPLVFRVVPTVTCMLAGSEYIRTFLPVDNIIVSTSISSVIAAILSQIIGTPSENIRIYRIQQSDYTTPIFSITKKFKLARLYNGFWYRALALGIQSSFTLSAANMASVFSSKEH